MNWLEKLLNLFFNREALVVAPCRTPLRYCFFGVQGNQIEETHSFVNLVQPSVWGNSHTPAGRESMLNELVGQCVQAKTHGKQIMVNPGFMLFKVPSSPLVPFTRDEAVQNMIQLCDALRDAGVINLIVAWYPVDEPNIPENSLTDQQVVDAINVVRDVSQHYTAGVKPIGVIYGVQGSAFGHYPGIGHYDWCGIDNYGVNIFANGQYANLVSNLAPDQKTIIVPGGDDPWQEDPIPFYNHAQTDTRVIMIMPFKWFDPNGIRSNGMSPEYHQVGSLVVATNPFPIEEPMPEPVRFPAQIPYDASFWAIQVFSQMSNNDWPGAQQTYNQHKKDVDDSMGAVDYWRQQFIPGTPTGPTGPTPPTGGIVNVDMQWHQQPGRWPVNPFGNRVYAFKLVVPSDAVPGSVIGSTTVYEYGGPPHLRIISVSENPGEFPGMYEAGGVQATINWNVGGGTDVALQPGKTYYINVKNADPVDQDYPAQVETFWPH